MKTLKRPIVVNSQVRTPLPDNCNTGNVREWIEDKELNFEVINYEGKRKPIYWICLDNATRIMLESVLFESSQPLEPMNLITKF